MNIDKFKSLKTMYDRNKSMDLIDNNHIFKFAVATPSNKGIFGGLKHDRNKTIPYKQNININHCRYHSLNQQQFDNLSYSISPSPSPSMGKTMKKLNIYNHVPSPNTVNTINTINTNATSTTNTFDNTSQNKQYKL